MNLFKVSKEDLIWGVIGLACCTVFAVALFGFLT